MSLKNLTKIKISFLFPAFNTKNITVNFFQQTDPYFKLIFDNNLLGGMTYVSS